MRYIGRRKIFPRRRTAKRKPSGFHRFLALGLALMLAWELLCEAGTRFISQELVEEAVQHYLRGAVNQAVSAELSDGESAFAAVSQTVDGRVAGVTADAAALNKLKIGVLERLEKTLNGRMKTSVPIGSLTKLGILNGRGPGIPLRLNIHGSADVTFDTEFTSAGLNQSCHRVTMTVRVQAYSQSRRFEAAIEAETSTVLSETVVVGTVPQAALLTQ